MPDNAQPEGKPATETPNVLTVDESAVVKIHELSDYETVSEALESNGKLYLADDNEKIIGLVVGSRQKDSVLRSVGMKATSPLTQTSCSPRNFVNPNLARQIVSAITSGDLQTAANNDFSEIYFFLVPLKKSAALSSIPNLSRENIGLAPVDGGKTYAASFSPPEEVESSEDEEPKEPTVPDEDDVLEHQEDEPEPTPKWDEEGLELALSSITLDGIPKPLDDNGESLTNNGKLNTRWHDIVIHLNKARSTSNLKFFVPIASPTTKAPLGAFLPHGILDGFEFEEIQIGTVLNNGIITAQSEPFIVVDKNRKPKALWIPQRYLEKINGLFPDPAPEVQIEAEEAEATEEQPEPQGTPEPPPPTDNMEGDTPEPNDDEPDLNEERPGDGDHDNDTAEEPPVEPETAEAPDSDHPLIQMLDGLPKADPLDIETLGEYDLKPFKPLSQGQKIIPLRSNGRDAGVVVSAIDLEDHLKFKDLEHEYFYYFIKKLAELAEGQNPVAVPADDTRFVYLPEAYLQQLSPETPNAQIESSLEGSNEGIAEEEVKPAAESNPDGDDDDHVDPPEENTLTDLIEIIDGLAQSNTIRTASLRQMSNTELDKLAGSGKSAAVKNLSKFVGVVVPYNQEIKDLLANIPRQEHLSFSSFKQDFSVQQHLRKPIVMEAGMHKVVYLSYKFFEKNNLPLPKAMQVNDEADATVTAAQPGTGTGETPETQAPAVANNDLAVLLDGLQSSEAIASGTLRVLYTQDHLRAATANNAKQPITKGRAEKKAVVGFLVSIDTVADVIDLSGMKTVRISEFKNGIANILDENVPVKIKLADQEYAVYLPKSFIAATAEHAPAQKPEEAAATQNPNAMRGFADAADDQGPEDKAENLSDALASLTLQEPASCSYILQKFSLPKVKTLLGERQILPLFARGKGNIVGFLMPLSSVEHLIDEKEIGHLSYDPFRKNLYSEHCQSEIPLAVTTSENTQMAYLSMEYLKTEHPGIDLEALLKPASTDETQEADETPDANPDEAPDTSGSDTVEATEAFAASAAPEPKQPQEEEIEPEPAPEPEADNDGNAIADNADSAEDAEDEPDVELVATDGQGTSQAFNLSALDAFMQAAIENGGRVTMTQEVIVNETIKTGETTQKNKRTERTTSTVDFGGNRPKDASDGMG